VVRFQHDSWSSSKITVTNSHSNEFALSRKFLLFAHEHASYGHGFSYDVPTGYNIQARLHMRNFKNLALLPFAQCDIQPTQLIDEERISVSAAFVAPIQVNFSADSRRQPQFFQRLPLVYIPSNACN
jgi:hypothetical protein